MNQTQIAEIAARVAIEHLEKEKQKQVKAKHDWRLRNTKLLLKNYRGFVSHSVELEEEISALDRAGAIDDIYDEDFAVAAIKRSKKRTLAMVRFMQRMITEYGNMCEQSGQSEDIRRSQIIQAMYILEDKISIEDIAKCHKIDTRTVYRDVNEAVKTLTVLIFGVDGIRFE